MNRRVFDSVFIDSPFKTDAEYWGRCHHITKRVPHHEFQNICELKVEFLREKIFTDLEICKGWNLMKQWTFYDCLYFIKKEFLVLTRLIIFGQLLDVLKELILGNYTRILSYEGKYLESALHDVRHVHIFFLLKNQ